MKNFIRQIERIQILNKLIASRRTGNPEELAKRLGVSRSQLYLIIDHMKDMGLEISFSRRLNSFFYEEDSRLFIEFTLKVMTPEEGRKVAGGKMTGQNLIHPFFWT